MQTAVRTRGKARKAPAILGGGPHLYLLTAELLLEVGRGNLTSFVNIIRPEPRFPPEEWPPILCDPFL